jgi:hypothetical protein
MLEAFKIAGAIVAFATALFTIWDRWVRGWPRVEPKIKFFGVNPYKYIRIQNPGPGDVFVLGVSASPPGIYGVAKNLLNDAILQATAPTVFGDADLRLLLQPGEKFDLPIMELRQPEDRPSRRVRFVISWRKTVSMRLWQVPVSFTITTGDFEHMAAAADPERSEKVPSSPGHTRSVN